MPIEINLGEIFGRIVVERKKSTSELLRNLLKDKKAIARAIDRYVDDKTIVPSGNYRGNSVMAPEILIASLEDNVGRYSLFHFPYTYELLVSEDGTIRQNKRLGKARTRDWDIKPYLLPEWFVDTVSRDQLESLIKERFYPPKS